MVIHWMTRCDDFDEFDDFVTISYDVLLISNTFVHVFIVFSYIHVRIQAVAEEYRDSYQIPSVSACPNPYRQCISRV